MLASFWPGDFCSVIMVHDGHPLSRACAQDFGTYRTLRLHAAVSASCWRKRKLAEGTEENAEKAGGAVDQLWPPEGVNGVHTEFEELNRI